MKEKQNELIKPTFNRESLLYLTCTEKRAFCTSEQSKRYYLWPCQKVLTLLCVMFLCVFCHFSIWFLGSRVVFDCIDSSFVPSYLLL